MRFSNRLASLAIALAAAASLSATPALARQADPATQDLHAALDVAVVTGLDSVVDLVRISLDAGADPLAPVEAQGRQDSYAYLVALAEDAAEREAQGLIAGGDWRAAAYRAFALMEARAAPASWTIYYLDAAVTRPGEDIAFSRESGGLRGTRDRMAVIAHAMESTAEPDASGFVRHDWAEAYEAMLAENG